jgi:hypothetical protein
MGSQTGLDTVEKRMKSLAAPAVVQSTGYLYSDSTSVEAGFQNEKTEMLAFRVSFFFGG